MAWDALHLCTSQRLTPVVVPNECYLCRCSFFRPIRVAGGVVITMTTIAGAEVVATMDPGDVLMATGMREGTMGTESNRTTGAARKCILA